MKNIIKKTVSILLVTIILFGSAPLAGFVGLELPEFNIFGTKAEAATSGTCGDNLTWMFDTSTSVLTIAGSGVMTDFTVITNSYSVNSDIPWFDFRSSIKAVNLTDGVTTIGTNAFYDCSNLMSVTIGDSITKISTEAFYSCGNLTSITIPNSVTYIGSNAFRFCKSLKELTMPASAKIYNSEYTFDGCVNIEKITLTMGTGTMQAYSTSTSDSSRTYYEYTPWYISGCEEIIIENGVKNISDYAFYECTSLKSITIPNSVTSIEYYSFYNCDGLTSVTIGNSVKTISTSAFESCDSLTSIIIPDSVTSIGPYAFRYCENLTNINISGNVKSFGNNVFYDTGFYNDVSNWENDVLYIGKYLIDAKGSITGICVVKEGTRIILDSAFEYCSGLKEVIIPDTVTTISDYAFSGCTSLENVVWGENVEEIGFGAFRNCALKSIEFHDSVKSIGGNAFNSCRSLTAIRIPDQVTTIENETFNNCESLTDITLPQNLTRIGVRAFDSCNKLENISIPDGVTFIGGSAFNNTGIYNNSSNWINDVLYIDNCLIEAKTTISGSYSIAEGTRLIASYAFEDCSNLTSVIIPEGITEIDYSTFYDCVNLSSVTIPDSVTRIDDYAFYNCEKFSNIIIPESVTRIGNYAFHNTGYYNDETNWSGKVLYISSCLIATDRPYYGISSNYSVEEGTTVIADNAFSFLSSALISVRIPKSIKGVGTQTLYNTTNFTAAYYQGTPEEWEENVVVGENSSSFIDKLVFECDSERPYYAPGICGENLSYILYTDGELVISGTGDMTDYSLSSSAPWYANSEKIKRVTLNGEITNIGDYAFYKCTNITSVSLPKDITQIGSYAFSGCSKLTKIDISENITYIGEDAFNGCAGIAVTNYEGNYKQWKDINIGENNDYLIKNILFECNSERPYYTPGVCGEELSYILYADGELVITGSGDMTNFTSSSNVPWSVYRDKIKSVTFPDEITSIGSYAFYNCTGITEINIPENATVIGDYAFYGCTELKEVLIPINISSIDDYAFDGCSGINIVHYPGNQEQWNNISIGTNNTYLTDNVLYECNSERPYYCSGSCGENLSYVLYADGKLVITGSGDMTNFTSSSNVPWPVYRDKIKSVTFPDEITSIGSYAFYNCTGITEIDIPENITSIGDYAFYGCSKLTTAYYTGTENDWKEITVGTNNGCLTANILYQCDSERPYYIGTCGDNITWTLYSDGEFVIEGIGAMTNYTAISTNAPWKSKRLLIKKVTVADEITHIGNYAFLYCGSLESVELGNGVKTIGTSAFDGCDALKNIVIPDSVTTIGNYAFQYCSKLETVTLGSALSTIGNYVFYQCNKISHAYYAGSETDWNKITVATGNTCLTNKLIYECNSENPYFAKGTCGDGVEWILTSDNELIISGEGDVTDYTSASAMPWYSDRALIEKVIIADGVTSIGDYAFFDCDNLTSVEMSDDVEIIGDNAFNDCEKITDLTIGNGVTTIGEYAFADNTSLTSVVIPDSVITIGNSAFRVCDAITSVTIGNGVETIGDSAFNGCWSLTELNIGGNVESIGDYAFNECGELVEAYYDGNSNEWSNIAIGTGNENLTDATIMFSEYIITWVCDYEECYEYVKPGEEIAIPESPEKTGYTFIGWTPEVPDVMPASGLTFTAVYTANSYDAVFDANGGAWADGTTERTETVDFDSEIVAPEAPSKLGYIFSGWSFEEINLGTDLGVMDDVNGKVFKAVWIASTDTVYTVETYIMNTEGEYEKSVQTFTGETDSTVTAEYTVEEGFTFNEEMSIISGVVAADNSLVLKVYIDRNTYTFTTIVDGVSTETEYFYGSIIAEPATPNKTGYTFVDWDNQIPATMPANNVTATAIFGVNSYNAIFDANGGKWSDGASTKAVATDFESEIVAPSNPTRQGYDFAGWDSEIGIMDDVNGKTFNAKWTARNDTKYTIEIYTMNTDGKYLVSKETQKGTTDTEVSATANVSTGFALNSVKSVLSGKVAANGSLVLKIYYDRNKYTFTTSIDGKAASKDYYFDASISKPANPVKAGYKFTGWDKEIPSKMPANDITVTAIFEKLSLEMSIRNPSTTTISYGDKIILHADMNEALPSGWKIKWTADNGNFSYSASSDGTTCTISPSKSGDTTFTTTVYDENGNVVSEDTQKMTSKAGFFDKIIAFFRGLFGGNKVIAQAFKGIF